MLRCEADCLLVQVPMVMANARGLLEAGRGFFDGSDRVVDLSGVQQADSSGLAVLLEWLRLNRAAGGQLRLAGVPDGLRALADLYDLDALFERA